MGFEPTVQLPVLRFSRPALSSTQPSLREWSRGRLPGLCRLPAAEPPRVGGIGLSGQLDALEFSLTKSVCSGKSRTPLPGQSRLDFSSSAGWGEELALPVCRGCFFLIPLISDHFRHYSVIPTIPSWPLVQNRPSGKYGGCCLLTVIYIEHML